MGKIYIDTVKYVIHANVEITGLVEKPDVVGAIFGQTEGLLGEELDLRELQKNGRIGRIEVNLQPKGNKSIGTIEVPSSLDLVETCIIASALETVDRVGPCEAYITVQRVEDTRNVKRKRVVERAKELVKKMITTEIPERKELSELVRAEVKTAEISSYGPEKLPAGPNIDSADSIILVEGRADVINLLKNDINNVIAIGGANVPKTIIDLCKKKEVTLFIDGDRGGEIIMKEVLNSCEVDYVARAPTGTEVEELTRKEILKALRSRVPVEQADSLKRRKEESHFEQQYKSQKDILSQQSQTTKQEISQPIQTLPSRQEQEQGGQPGIQGIPPAVESELNALDGSLKARFYDENMNMIAEVPVRDVTKALQEAKGVSTVILDGIITQRLVDITETLNIKTIAGIKMGNVFRKPQNLQIFVKQQI
ncbi:MAG: DNA primase DnaG [Candidatus Micrarchaeota archaeon]|nr:DNA primase DnaG [Candidatus Micrarchaeota archaeon]